MVLSRAQIPLPLLPSPASTPHLTTANPSLCPLLSSSHITTIWKNFLTAITSTPKHHVAPIGFRDCDLAELAELAEQRMNGREIKNMLKIAQLLAKHKGEAIAMTHQHRLHHQAELKRLTNALLTAKTEVLNLQRQKKERERRDTEGEHQQRLHHQEELKRLTNDLLRAKTEVLNLQRQAEERERQHRLHHQEELRRLTNALLMAKTEVLNLQRQKKERDASTSNASIIRRS